VYFVLCILHCISLSLVATLIYCSVYLAIQLPGSVEFSWVAAHPCR